MRTADADNIGDNEYLFELDCLQTIKGVGGRQVRHVKTI
jgi:euchromatic histone-lysine N-methyltransferase